MTYCSKEDCKFGIFCEHHISNKKDYEKNPYKEDLSKDTTVCVIAHYEKNSNQPIGRKDIMGSFNYDCDGRISMFDILPVEKPNDTNSIIREILMNTVLTGTGFDNGKKRVYALYQSDMTANDRAKAIKNEYGIGGGSLNGEYFRRGFQNHDAKGIEIEFDEQKQLFTWTEVEKIIHGLINSGKYLSEVEMAIYKCKVANKLGGCRTKQGKCGGYVVGVIGDTSPAPQCCVCKYNYYYDPSHVAELDDDDFD